MSPKEKAEELMMKYIIKLNYKLPLKDFGCIAEECALIAVDEILNRIKSFSFYNNSPLLKEEEKYWEKVKQEIKKL